MRQSAFKQGVLFGRFLNCTLGAYKLEDNAIFATVLLGISNEGYFLGRFLKNFPWSLLCTFSENAGFWVTLQKLPQLGYSRSFGANVCVKIFSCLCTLRAFLLEDNAICARVLLSQGYFLGVF